MSILTSNSSNLKDIEVNIRIKISALWVTIMFCYLYADYFELYIPGKMVGMLAGNIGPLGQVTQVKLVGTTLLPAIPTALIFLSLVLSPRITQWMNIIFGMVYSLVAIATLCSPGAWFFYQLFCAIEIVFTIMIVWYAWKWPKKPSVND